jgi:hypothetical protein
VGYASWAFNTQVLAMPEATANSHTNSTIKAVLRLERGFEKCVMFGTRMGDSCYDNAAKMY